MKETARQTWKIARREFRGYFDHPTAYILVVAFLAVTLFLGFRSLLSAGVATLRPVFQFLPWMLAVFVPAITMRSLAEERRSGTLEWLMAQPVNEVEVVLGKFVGDWLFALVALAGLLPSAAGLLLLSNADPGVMVAQFLGAALLAATLVSVGLFASSATKNQITAFILGAVVSFALVLLGTNFTLRGLPAVLSGPVGRLSVLRHFENVTRGVVDLRDVVYFVSASGVFLALAYFMVTRQRLSRRRGAYRRLEIGVGALAAGAVILNLLGGHFAGRLDLTRNDLYTLSDGTRQILRQAQDVVTVKLFVSRELPPEVQVTVRDVRDLLSDYERASDGGLRVEEVHPGESDEARNEARSLGVRQIQFNVLRGDEYQVKQGWLGLAVLYAGGDEVIPVIRETSDLEYRLSSAVSSLLSERKPRVRFLTGFGAGGPRAYPEFSEMLRRNYDVGTLSLQGDSVPGLTPDSVTVAVLAGPSSPMTETARSALDTYLGQGGAALILAEAAQLAPRAPMAQAVEAGLDSLLAPRGVRLVSRLVYDVRANQRVSAGGQGAFPVVRPFPFWPIVEPAGQHLITRNLSSVSLGWARPMEITDSTRVQALLQTTEAAGRRAASGPVGPQVSVDTDPSSLSVQTVAVAVTGGDARDAAGGGPPEAAAPRDDGRPPQPDGRLVVVGDATFLERNFVQAARQNLVFAANAVDWLSQDEALIGIRSKDRTPPPLVFDSELQQKTLRWGNLVGVPLLFVLLGAVRIVRRRRRSGRDAGEEAGA